MRTCQKEIWHCSFCFKEALKQTRPKLLFKYLKDPEIKIFHVSLSCLVVLAVQYTNNCYSPTRKRHSWSHGTTRSSDRFLETIAQGFPNHRESVAFPSQLHTHIPSSFLLVPLVPLVPLVGTWVSPLVVVGDSFTSRSFSPSFVECSTKWVSESGLKSKLRPNEKGAFLVSVVVHSPWAKDQRFQVRVNRPYSKSQKQVSKVESV